jgi:hypothetical protein
LPTGGSHPAGYGADSNAAASSIATATPAVKPTDLVINVHTKVNEPAVTGSSALFVSIASSPYTGSERRSRFPKRMNISSSSRLCNSVETTAIAKKATPRMNHARMSASRRVNCTHHAGRVDRLEVFLQRRRRFGSFRQSPEVSRDAC